MIPESDKCFDMTVVSDSKVKKRIYCLEKPREKWMFISGFKSLKGIKSICLKGFHNLED